MERLIKYECCGCKEQFIVNSARVEEGDNKRPKELQCPFGCEYAAFAVVGQNPDDDHLQGEFGCLWPSGQVDPQTCCSPNIERASSREQDDGKGVRTM
ncbi:hypothetical protein JJB07_14745 [Tumebacillus sp. ITR2]|uniref:Uncharacterized protein n=1 Tax=Tumebacillus amylolyticus TaxID=2801339 RepID=A0ABS1JCA5_9BACL|nr:hypothetical protein [Tumebacillus amylolyticus]MBL0387897.1 hypothetical protein [Tumebacillus amylolyticus]